MEVTTVWLIKDANKKTIKYPIEDIIISKPYKYKSSFSASIIFPRIKKLVIFEAML